MCENVVKVNVDMHQWSGLSPLLFVIVMETSSCEFRISLGLAYIGNCYMQMIWL